MKRFSVSALAAIAVAGVVAGSAAPAFASESGHDEKAVAITQHFIKNKSKVSSDYTNRSNRLASCKVANAGATCTIGTSSMATRTVSLAYTASRGWVTGQLGISSASSISTTVSCQSPKLAAGQTYNAYPRGDRWSYKIQEITTVSNIIAINKTSGTLYAFNPRANSIFCTT